MRLEETAVSIVPGFYQYIEQVSILGAEFFAGGVLLMFVAWTIGFAVGEVFKLLERDVLGRG